MNSAISGCTFSLVGIGLDTAEMPVITNSEMAGFPLEIRIFPQEGMISYGLSGPDNGYFAFILHTSVAGSEQEAADCRQMAEYILSTFHLVSQNEPVIEMPWEQTPVIPVTPMETTPTPSDEEAKKSPKVTPPVMPTANVIDLAPGANFGTTYDIVIRRAGTGELIYIRVLAGTDPELVLEKYLNPGDEIVERYVPLIGRPPPGPTLSETPTGTQETPLLPTATTASITPLTLFVGDNAYVPSKNFSLRYDAQLWTFLPTKGSTGSGPYLLKQSDEECYLALREGPRGDSYLGPTTIAGRAWRTSWLRGHYYVYSTMVGNDAFLFGLNLLTEANRQTACKEEIKQILATFTVVADEATLTYNPSTMMTTTLPPPITDERFPTNLPLCPNNYKTTPFSQEACQIIDASVMPLCSEGEVRLCKLVSYEMTTTLSEMEYTLLPADVISVTVPITRFTTVFVYGTPIFTATTISSEITGTIYIPYFGQ